MLTMGQKKAVTRELRDRYQRLSKKGKTIFLNEFIQLTRYNRSYSLTPARASDIIERKRKGFWYERERISLSDEIKDISRSG